MWELCARKVYTSTNIRLLLKRKVLGIKCVKHIAMSSQTRSVLYMHNYILVFSWQRLITDAPRASNYIHILILDSNRYYLNRYNL